MAAESRKINRTATDRLLPLVESELARRGLNEKKVAREARLPADGSDRCARDTGRPSTAPTSLCRALGISMTIGATPSATARSS